MPKNKNSTKEGLESSLQSKFQVHPLPKLKKSHLHQKSNFKFLALINLKKIISLSKATLESPIQFFPGSILNNLSKISSQAIATDTADEVSSRISKRKTSIEKSLDSETTTVSTNKKNSPKQNEMAINKDVITENIELSQPQNTTDVPIRISSRISERKKRVLNKILESEATTSTTSEEKYSEQKEGEANKDIVSNDIEETPPQTTVDVPTKVSSRISKKKKRALDESCNSDTEMPSASGGKNPKQKKKPVKTDIVTEDVESSSEDEEVTTENDDNINDSQVGKPRHRVDIEIGDKLKKILEHDHNLINNKNKLIVLPAQPTVISILETWVLDYTTTLIEKMSNKRHKFSEAQDIINDTIIDINLCREVADGIRVYFDHTLAGLLLYGVERDQCNSMMLKTKAVSVSLVREKPTTIKDKTNESNRILEKQLNEKQKSSSPQRNYEDEENKTKIEKASIKASTSRASRSSYLVSVKGTETSKSVRETKQKTESLSSLTKTRSKSPQEEPESPEPLDEIKQKTENMSRSASTSPKTSGTLGLTLRSFSSAINSNLVNELTEKAKIWRLVTDDKIKSSMPSNVYGAIHLARLFVKLPGLLRKQDFTKARLKVVVKYIRMFLSFLRNHEEWFGEQFYMLKTAFEKSNTNQ